MSFVADIDECREGSHLCDQFQNCINTFGAHECRCKNGFELDSSSGSCVGNNLSLRVTGFFFVTSRQVTSRSSEQKMKEWWKVLVAAQGRLLSRTMIVFRGYSGALNQNSHWSEFCYSSKLLAMQTRLTYYFMITRKRSPLFCLGNDRLRTRVGLWPLQA